MQAVVAVRAGWCVMQELPCAGSKDDKRMSLQLHMRSVSLFLKYENHAIPARNPLPNKFCILLIQC